MEAGGGRVGGDSVGLCGVMLKTIESPHLAV